MSTVQSNLVEDADLVQMNDENEIPREDFVGREHELIIEPGRTERHYWRELWQYRELFRVLAWRDISVRYKQTVIGAAWALIRPFLTMVVFTVVFGKLPKLPSDGTAPYALLLGGESQLYLPGLWLSLGVTGLFIWLGTRQFRKMEKKFADLI
jgi:ABC-type polysaccharide/polyol phosphate export permease